ncbi:MAG: hypothetical protein B6D46_10130 [Polyangiaceae bacterium UTPRO1]|nr:MAG: hypothetical protein B6D46_10130 [Polyangiaceae bacterium UTPRO1]
MKLRALVITSAGDGARVRHENRDGSCTVERGEVAHRATLARKLRRTRAQVTQLLGVRQPAADLQEAVLRLEAVDGRKPMSGRTQRAVARAGTREEQRAAWGLPSMHAGRMTPITRRRRANVHRLRARVRPTGCGPSAK